MQRTTNKSHGTGGPGTTWGTDCQDDDRQAATGGHGTTWGTDCQDDDQQAATGGPGTTWGTDCRDDDQQAATGGHGTTWGTDCQDDDRQAATGGHGTTWGTDCQDDDPQAATGGPGTTWGTDCQDHDPQAATGGHGTTWGTDCQDDNPQAATGGPGTTWGTDCQGTDSRSARAESTWRSRRTGLLLVLMLSLVSGCLGVPDPLPDRPVAVAGIDQIVPFGVPVRLDGSASSTPNAGPLSFSWRFTELPAGSLLTDADLGQGGAGAAETAFTPDRGGRYVVRLTLTDDLTTSVDDFVAIDVEGGPPAPQAEAGPDQTVKQGMAVYLDGSSSQAADGAPLYYRWTLAGTPALSHRTTADLVNRYTPFPTLEVDAGGIFTLALTVTDGETESTPDYVYVVVEDNNAAPMADAGGDRTIEACTEVTLDGSSSYDLDRDPLSYAWNVLLGPVYSEVTSASLSDPDQPVTRFYADLVGSYVVQLSVSDGVAVSVPAVVELRAVARAHNQAPAVVAGEDVELSSSVVCTGSGPDAYCPACPALSVPLDGTGTVDADGDPLVFGWSVEEVGPAGSKATGQIQDSSRLSTTVELRGAGTGPGLTTVTTLTVQLSATDCPGATGKDTLEIRYRCTGEAG